MEKKVTGYTSLYDTVSTSWKQQQQEQMRLSSFN